MKGGATQAVTSFSLAAALGLLTKPARPNERPLAQWSREEKRVWTEAKRQYSDDLSRELTKAVELSLRTHFPKTHSGEGGWNERGERTGVKSIDVAFNIEGLFLASRSTTIWCGLCRQRNPKLRVEGMPEVDDNGAVTAASPALDEAFSDD